MKKGFVQKNKVAGFTLIELMVSVAIFAIVLLFALGSIITIVDANRKARTLTSVMNNVNFSFENMTRSLKTGKDIRTNVATGSCTNGGSVPSNASIEVNAIDLTGDVDEFTRVLTTYRLCEKDGKGVVEKKVGAGLYQPITSSEVDIDVLNFYVFADDTTHGSGAIPAGEQPRILIVIGGSVEFVRNVRSEFNIQTTVTQRDLNTP